MKILIVKNIQNVLYIEQRKFFNPQTQTSNLEDKITKTHFEGVLGYFGDF
jgi:hypothetical protein